MVTRRPALEVQNKKILKHANGKQKERWKEKERKRKKEFGSWSCVQSSSFAYFFPASFGSSLVLLL
jgi:hypothetical protein